MKVRLLRDALINQIAAGEVVERPASIVKELVENALDAGATTIAVDLKEGGRSLVGVVDDGEGMSRDDALMAIERHATSKIQTSEDLARVCTLGFRGEALPSIASVSRFEILTRRAEDELGTRVRVEGGELRDVRDAGAALGTEVRARNLFFNVPVRRRFLRTAATEVSHCADIVVQQAMTRPDVAFTLRHDGRVLVEAPACETVAVRAVQLLGAEAERLAPCQGRLGGIAVDALLSPPTLTRSSARQAMFLYVNGRFVRDRVLQRAVREAYRGRLAAGRFPILIVQLRLDPLHVDVNVHPSKVEVRFRDPRDVGSALSEILRDALEGLGGPAPDRPWQRRPADPRSEPLPFHGTPALPAHPDDAGMSLAPLPSQGDEPVLDQGVLAGAPAAPAERGLLAGEPEQSIPEATISKAASRVRVVGLLRDRILLADDGQDLLLVDVERARAAVARAELERDPLALGGPMRLLVPRSFSVGERVVRALEPRCEELLAHGVDLAVHGPGELLVKAAPAGLRGLQWEDALPNLARTGDLTEALAVAHASVQGPPSDYGLRALLAALDELSLLGRLARRVSVSTLLGEG